MMRVVTSYFVRLCIDCRGHSYTFSAWNSRLGFVHVPLLCRCGHCKQLESLWEEVATGAKMLYYVDIIVCLALWDQKEHRT